MVLWMRSPGDQNCRRCRFGEHLNEMQGVIEQRNFIGEEFGQRNGYEHNGNVR